MPLPQRVVLDCVFARQRALLVDLRDFVGENLEVQPMPYLVGGIPLAVALLAPELGVEALQRRARTPRTA